MNKILIAVYGSLRKGEFNHRGDMKYLGTEVLTGARLFDLQVGYPAATPDSTGAITVDVVGVDSTTFVRLNHMETSAGYGLKDVMTSHGIAFTWLMCRQRIKMWYPTAIPVEGGDWSKRTLTELERKLRQ